MNRVSHRKTDLTTNKSLVRSTEGQKDAQQFVVYLTGLRLLETCEHQVVRRKKKTAKFLLQLLISEFLSSSSCV